MKTYSSLDVGKEAVKDCSSACDLFNISACKEKCILTVDYICTYQYVLYMDVCH